MANMHVESLDQLMSLVPDLPPGRELEEGSRISIESIPRLDDTYPATQALHADDVLHTSSDVSPPIHVSTTFRYPRESEHLVPAKDLKSVKPTQHVYSRVTTQSTTRLEATLATLLRSPNPVITYSSGLAAIHAIFTFLTPKVVSIGDGYHGTHGVLSVYRRLTKAKVISLDCPASDLDVGDLIWLETPINPTGEALNIKAFAEKAHSRGAYLGVDSTFGPPPLQDPLSLGADIVMHSGTKYIGGHSDLLCGIVAVKRAEWVPRMLADRIFLGSVMGGLEGWLGLRSIRTLELRVERQARNASDLVAWLQAALNPTTTDSQPLNTTTNSLPTTPETTTLIRSTLSSILPHSSLQSLPTHPDSPWLNEQMPNPGLYSPVFSILTHTEAQARALPSHLRFFQHATSLGGVESLIEWRCMSDAHCDRRLLRLSVGVEDVRDLAKDILGGLEAVKDVVG